MIEVAKRQLVGQISIGLHEGPGKLPTARVPPGHAGGEEQVINTVAIEVARSVLPKGVSVVAVVVDGNLVIVEQIYRVALTRACEDIVLDKGLEADRSANADVIGILVLKGVFHHVEPRRVPAGPVPAKEAALLVSMDIEDMHVKAKMARRMLASALENQILKSNVAAGRSVGGYVVVVVGQKLVVDVPQSFIDRHPPVP